MKNTSGFTHLVIAILISIMAVGLVGVAWYYQLNKEDAIQLKGNSRMLLTVEKRGGLCFDKENNTGYGCNSEFTLYTSGKYVLTRNINENVETINKGREGSVQHNKIVKLQQLIQNANFTQLKSIPFTDTCPTAYDGREVVYTFYRNGGTERLPTCEYKIDTDNDLIKLADELSQWAWPQTD